MEIKQNPFSLYDFLGYFVPGAIFTYSLIFVASLADPTKSFRSILSTYFDFERIEFYLPFTLGAYTIGHILSFVSSITIEKYSLWKLGFPSKYLLGLGYPEYYDVQEPKPTRVFLRTIIALFLLPITFLDIILGNFLRLHEIHAKSLDPALRAILQHKVSNLVEKLSRGKGKRRKREVKAGGVDFFRFAYHYVVEHAPNHVQKMQNYVALYGFLRTLTLITILLFWINLFFQPLGYAPFALISAILSFILYLDFNKFYRRFSLEVLMALSAVS
ncbi:MAG: hypothetical protein ACRDFQ_01670 [Anaerolineales bacterium]